MEKIQITFTGEGEINQQQLANLKAEDIHVLTARKKNLKQIELICGQTNLRWLDLRNNLIQDNELVYLSRLRFLQVLLLDNNLIEKTESLIESLKESFSLSLLSLFLNPVLKQQQNIEELKKCFMNTDIHTQPVDETILTLRKKCIILQIKSERKDKEFKQLRRQLFEDKSHNMINLGRYLIELKVQCPNYAQIIHTLFLTLRRIGKQNPQIKQKYHNLPWYIITEWPNNNFIQQNKINCSEVQHVLETESIEYSTNLEMHLQNLLNQYYALELSKLFNVCKAKINYCNLNRLLDFLLSTCRQYFMREEQEYKEWIAVAFPFPIQIKPQLIQYFIEQGVQKLEMLQILLNKDINAAYTPEQRMFLNQIKKMSFKKVFQRMTKQSTNKSFSKSIMQFFSQILNLYTDGAKLITNNKAQNILFAKFLFQQFDSSDVYYLSLLLREGEMRNQEHFLNNRNKLGEIVCVKLWLDSIEQQQKKLITMPKCELNLGLAVFFKKVLGRPEFNLLTIKKYFPKFDFNEVERFIDCYERPQILELFEKRLGNDFSFIRESIILRKQNIKILQMKKILNQNKILSLEQEKFVQKSICIFKQTRVVIEKNPLFYKILNQIPTTFSLLHSILSVNPNSVQVDQIIQTNNEDRLYNLQNRYLLQMLKSVIRVDEKHIQLVNREKCWFSNNLESLKTAKFYQKHQYIFDFIRFSYTLYLEHLQDVSPVISHKNIINPQQILKTNNLKVYLQKINNKYVLSDYLLDICKQEVRDLVFVVQQDVLSFEMLKFRQLAKNPTCKYCFDKDFYQELQLISNTNGIYYIEVHEYSKNKFNDKKLRQALLESYHEQVLLHCLKKQLMNFGQYSQLLEKAEDMAKVKGFQLRLPLYQISRIVRTQTFQKSEFKVELFKFLKSKSRSEQDRKKLLNYFTDINKKIKQKQIFDQKKFEFVKQMFQMEQNKLCETFILNISLICSIEFRSKVYQILDWTLLDSFAFKNYLAHWKQEGIPEIEERMTKYKRVLYRYLSNPTNFKGDRSLLNRATDKLEDLILTQQINVMLGSIVSVQKQNKKGLTLAFILIHQSLKILEARGDVGPVEGFNYQICLSIRKKLNHKGFLILTDYLKNGITLQNREDVQEIIDNISYKIQYYKSLNIIKRLLLQRQYNPVNYFNALCKTLYTLSKINILNTQIEAQFIKNRYPRFPWSFIIMTTVLEQKSMWYKILLILEQKHGIYLQLIHYLDTRDETDGILILRQFFEAIYSQMCCNNLIKRIISILPLSENLDKICKNLIDSALTDCVPTTQTNVSSLIDSEIKADYTQLSNHQLLAYLRLVSLKGQYLNRIEKSSNRLRNMLCDYDEQGLDIRNFLQTHSTKQSQRSIRSSILETLKICLKYKCNLSHTNHEVFFTPIKSKLTDRNNSKILIEHLSTLNFKKQFVGFKQPDLHLTFILLSQPEDVVKYFTDIVLLYKSLISDLNPQKSGDTEWQAAEFIHVAILTVIRLKNKYKMVANANFSIQNQLAKQPYRVYRNHLAHYIPSGRMLAEKKLNIKNYQDTLLLNKNIDSMIKNFKL